MKGGASRRAAAGRAKPQAPAGSRGLPGDGSAGGPDRRRGLPVLAARVLPVHVAAFALAVLVFVPGGPVSFLPAAVAVPVVAAALLLAMPGPGGVGSAPLLPRRAATAVEAAGLSWILAAYGLFKVAGLHPSGTDDNIYFYLAMRLSEGATPYRDFFFAHPPVHLLVPAAVFGIGGWSIGLAKAIPVVAQVVAAGCLYAAIRPASRATALVAVALHLFAYQVLMGSTDMNGENLMTAFLAGGLLAGARGRHGAAGLLGGLALGCGLYALAGVLALGIGAAIDGRRSLARFGLGVLATFGGICAVFGTLGGRAFWDGVVAYHLEKAVRDPDKVPVLAGANPFAWLAALVRNLAAFLGDRTTAKWLYFHLPIVLASGVAMVALARKAGAARLGGALDRLAWTGLAAGGLYVLQWAALAETYDFYLVPMWFFLSLPAASGIGRTWAGIRSAGWDRRLAWPAAAGMLLLLHPAGGRALSDALWPEERAAAGETVRYEWREPRALGALAPVSRALFFREHRTRGDDEPPWRHAMWNKLLTFGTVDDIARIVRDGSRPGDTLTGASTLAPLVALEAGLRVAGDEADTNGKRFRTGTLTDADLARRACADDVRWLVAAPRSHFEPARIDADPLWSSLFARHREFSDPGLLHRRPFPIVLYRRKDGATLPDGAPCGGP